MLQDQQIEVNEATFSRREWLCLAGSLAAGTMGIFSLQKKPLLDPNFDEVLGAVKSFNLPTGDYQDFGTKEIALFFPKAGAEAANRFRQEVEVFKKLFGINQVGCELLLPGTEIDSEFIEEQKEHNLASVYSMQLECDVEVFGLENLGTYERILAIEDLNQALMEYEKSFSAMSNDSASYESTRDKREQLEEQIDELILEADFMVTLTPFTAYNRGNFEEIIEALKFDMQTAHQQRAKAAVKILNDKASISNSKLVPFIFSDLYSRQIKRELKAAKISFIEVLDCPDCHR